jgi:hypothetical protein
MVDLSRFRAPLPICQRSPRRRPRTLAPRRLTLPAVARYALKLTMARAAIFTARKRTDRKRKTPVAASVGMCV